jgi:uncharacterized protein
MAHPNTDVIRQWAKALEAGDLDAAAGLLADEVTWHIGGRGPLAGDWKGKDRVVNEFLPTLGKLWDRLEIDIHELLASDQHVVALINRKVERGGKSAEQKAAAVYHVSGGKISEAWILEADQYAVDEFESS